MIHFIDNAAYGNQGRYLKQAFTEYGETTE